MPTAPCPHDAGIEYGVLAADIAADNMAAHIAAADEHAVMTDSTAEGFTLVYREQAFMPPPTDATSWEDAWGLNERNPAEDESLELEWQRWVNWQDANERPVRCPYLLPKRQGAPAQRPAAPGLLWTQERHSPGSRVTRPQGCRHVAADAWSHFARSAHGAPGRLSCCYCSLSSWLASWCPG